MAFGWVAPAWVEPGWVDLGDEELAVVIPSGELVSAATAYGDPGVLETWYDQTHGPAVAEVLVGFQFASGLYLYGYKMPSAVITADAMDRRASLLSLGDLPITSSPQSHDLIASIGASEVSRVTMTFDNSQGEWSQRLVYEPVLLQSVTIWSYYGGTNLRKIYTGQVTAVELRGSITIVECSEP